MDTFAIRRLSFAYPEQAVNAVEELSLTVGQGEFWIICGPSGSGKSTLLRQLKPVLSPHGRRSGEIWFEGKPLETLDQRAQSQRIGFVSQSPDNQIVTDKVWHELAFGLESLGFDTPTIRRRVAEMASFFGIQNWFYRDVTGLSGGQKQLLNLAAVMVMQPSVLILDEPTAQLDPIAAADFIAILGRLNRELGTTVILTEHRLEEALPLASAMAVMDRGRLLCAGTPKEVGAALKAADHPIFLAMPTAMRVWAAAQSDEPCPVTVQEGQDWLAAFAGKHPLQGLPEEVERRYPGGAAISAHGLWFRYEKELPDAVKGWSLTVQKGEFLALLGGNGTGKTTSLKLLAGLLKPYRGELQISGSVAALPQNPQALFVKKTLGEDLFALLSGRPKEEQAERVGRVVKLCRLGELLDRHPYDLSGGEQQRAALAKVLLLEPDILLLDEPTKGLDAEFKEALGGILQSLLSRGMTVVMASHDTEFCARYAHRCALFFDGSTVAEGSPRAFFSGNSFYTTSANRMARALLPEAVTPEDVMGACGGALPPAAPPIYEESALPEPGVGTPEGRLEKLPWWRRGLAAVSGGTALAIFTHAIRMTDLTKLIAPEGLTALSAQQLGLYAGFIVSLFLFAACITRRSSGTNEWELPEEKRRLSKRTAAAAVLLLLLVPVTLLVGETCFGGRKYEWISLMILLETMLPFFLVFEGRKPQGRELVVIAVLCAAGVAGRAFFFMLPQFKPVMALTVIAGVALGGEAGFVVGAATMLVSNILFSQGPWTPWQMFAMGIIGFLAGVLFQKGLLRRSRGSLCVFGALSAVLIYGGIMNLASALIWVGELNGKILAAYYLSGFPMDCIQAAATWLFLWFAGEGMLEKLERIKVKYGLL